jgi:hypothetical protein
MYSIATIGGLFDGAPPLPIDPSWIPKVQPDGSLALPDGKVVVPATSPAPVPGRELAAAAAAGFVVGAILVWAVFR